MFNCFKRNKITPQQAKPGDIIHIWENGQLIQSVTVGHPESIIYHVVSPLQNPLKDNILQEI